MNDKAALNNFDIVRNTLSFLVFFTHWNILTAREYDFFIFHLSGIAIDAFFVVSGYLIWRSYCGDQRPSSFYMKRFFRIFPLYFSVITLQTLFLMFFSNGTAQDLARYFFANIFFLNFLAPTSGDVFNNLAVDAINGSLWTLKNEVAFYFIVPLLHKVFHRRGAKVLFYIYGFSVAYMLYFYYGDIVNLWGSRSLTSEKMLVQFPAQLRLFLVGIILYIYFDKFATYRPALSATISLIFVIVFREEAIFRATVYPLFLGVCLIYAVYFIKPVIIRFDFSFSFYIVHFPLIQLSLLFGFNPVNPVASFALLFFLTILISFLSEMYIERPSIGFGKTLIRRRP